MIIIPGSHETSTSCPLVDMTQGKKGKKNRKRSGSSWSGPLWCRAWLVVALKINAVQLAKRRINRRLSEMLTIIPYEVKPCQINKEHKNPYKEICQQKLKKKRHCTLSYVMLEPLQKKEFKPNYKYKTRKKVKYSRNTNRKKNIKIKKEMLLLFQVLYFNNWMYNRVTKMI